MCVYDYNKILTVPINNRSDKKMIQSFTELATYIKAQVLKPWYHVMDNEASTTIKNEIKDIEVQYQLVPTGKH